jgi:hypothetical protein
MQSVDTQHVGLGAVKEDVAVQVLGGEKEQRVSSVEASVPRFVSMDFPEFTAEHAVNGPNLVIHFFLPPWARALSERGDTTTIRQLQTYWIQDFPQVLSPVAIAYFQANAPQLEARYTAEVASWWFLARGFGQVLDPQALASGFYAALRTRLLEAGYALPSRAGT